VKGTVKHDGVEVKQTGSTVVALFLAAFLFLLPFYSQAQDPPQELSGSDEAWLESLEEEGGDLDEYAARLVADPLEPWNRAMFTFNDKLYFWVLKPVARGYGAVLPETVRRGVGNFFYNIRFPIRFVNNILQGKFKSGALEFERFFINTFFGGLGLADLSDRHPELRVPREDTGQTLGKYGLGNGIYIVWPLLGPSTLRDSVGLAGDFFLDPLNYLEPTEAATGAKVGDRVNVVSFSIGEYEAIKGAAFDPYIAIRDGYIQYRQNQIEN
jgi:phospholipid-binding lipoprotein MlaA